MNWIDYTLIVLAIGITIFAFVTGIWPISYLFVVVNLLVSLLGG